MADDPGGTWDAVVVGAGIAGASLAYFLAAAGVRTLHLESREPGAGASGVRIALINPFRGRSARAGPWDVQGATEFWRLSAEIEGQGLATGAERTGVLRFADGPRQARSWRNGGNLRELARTPAPFRAPGGAFLVEGGGYVHPPTFLSALLEAARRHGASFVSGCEVGSLRREKAGWRATTSRGDVRGDAIFLCLGAGRLEGVDLPDLEPVAGDMITLQSPVRLPFPVAGPTYFASRRERVFVGGNHRGPERIDTEAPELLRSSASRLAPPLADAPIVETWSGVRVRRADNLPVAEELQPGLWYLGAFGGRGFLTAPLLARRTAEQVLARAR